MGSEKTEKILKWLLVPPTLILMGTAWYVAAHPEWFGEASDKGFFSIFFHAPFTAAMVTLGVICLSELAISKMAGLGEPVIGKTILNGVISLCLVLTFYTIFAISSVFGRLSGGASDPPPENDSYWTPREKAPVTLEEFRKQ